MAALIIAVAVGAMILQDTFDCLKQLAVSRRRKWLPGILDMLGWLTFLASTAITLKALSGHSPEVRYLTVAAVAASNVVGYRIGAAIGERFVEDTPTSVDLEQQKAIDALTASVVSLNQAVFK